MKFPVRSIHAAHARFLEFDPERELLSLVSAEGASLWTMEWRTLIGLITAQVDRRTASETRSVPRAALALKVSYRLPDGKAIVSVTRDIGAGGLFIETGDPLPRGTEVAVAFTLPDPPFEQITARGRIAWTRSRAERYVLLPGMGLQFMDLVPEMRRRIDTLVQRVNDARRAA